MNEQEAMLNTYYVVLWVGDKHLDVASASSLEWIEDDFRKFEHFFSPKSLYDVTKIELVKEHDVTGERTIIKTNNIIPECIHHAIE